MTELHESQNALLQELENLGHWKAAEQARSQRRLFLDRVRDAAWRMRKQEDLEEFLMVVRDSLRAMGVPFHACGVNQVLSDTDPPRGISYDIFDDDRGLVQMDTQGIEIVRELWQRQEVLYRRDIAIEDRFDEKGRIDRVYRGAIRSILDVPFSHGTLAVNSRLPDAFTEAHIESLQGMAAVLSDGFRRLDDLAALERRNAELAAEIAERRRLERQVIELERLRAVQELSNGFCHNFNNILTGVLGPAQLIRKYHGSNPDLLELADFIIENTGRASTLVQRLSRALHHRPELLVEAVDLNAAVRQAVVQTQAALDAGSSPAAPVELSCELGEAPPIQAVRAELDSVLQQLIANALDAMPHSGSLSLRTRAAADQVELVVADTGTGMDEETRRRVFEPFFTTKMNVGPGLGLFIVYGAMQRWQGAIQVHSQPGAGAVFTLRFQLWQGPTCSGESTARQAPTG